MNTPRRVADVRVLGAIPSLHHALFALRTMWGSRSGRFPEMLLACAPRQGGGMCYPWGPFTDDEDDTDTTENDRPTPTQDVPELEPYDESEVDDCFAHLTDDD